MMNLSMALVTASFVNEQKGVTRRSWTDSHARKFKKGNQIKVYNKSPRNHGEVVGYAEILEWPYRERTGVRKVDELYVDEGFKFLDDQYNPIGRPLYDLTKKWIKDNLEYWVLEIEPTEILPGMVEKYSTEDEISRCVHALIKQFGATA